MEYNHKENTGLSSPGSIEQSSIEILPEDEKFATKNQSQVVVQFLISLCSYVILGCTFSEIYLFYLVPLSRGKTSSSLLMATTISSHSNFTPPRSQEVEISRSKHGSPSSTSPVLSSRRIPSNMSRSASDSELRLLQSRFGSGTPLVQNEQTKSQVQKQAGTIRAAQPGSQLPIEAEIGQLVIPTANAGQNIANKILNKDVMTIDINEILTHPPLKIAYSKISNRFIDCKRNLNQDFVDLEYGLTIFCDYSHLTEAKKFSNEDEVKIIHQKVSAAQALLTTDFKRKDSGINKFKYNYFTGNKYRLSGFADVDKWPDKKRDRYLVFQLAKEKVFDTLKLWLSDDMEALLFDFMQIPHFYLPIHVCSYAPMYFHDKWAEIEGIFSSKLESDSIELQTKLSLKPRPRDFSFTPWKNRAYFWKNRAYSLKLAELYRSNSHIFAKEAEDEAIALIKKEKSSLVAYYNEKNPDQLPYAERYMRFTGMQPKIPYNRHTLACLPAAFANVASRSSTSEIGLI